MSNYEEKDWQALIKKATSKAVTFIFDSNGANFKDAIRDIKDIKLEMIYEKLRQEAERFTV